MNVKVTNTGHRRGFIQGKILNPGNSVELNDVDKDGIKQLEKVQWLAVEKVLKKTKKGEEEKIKTTDEVKE